MDLKVHTKYFLNTSLALVLGLGLSACGGGGDDKASSEAKPSASSSSGKLQPFPKDKATASVKGSVKFSGKAPRAGKTKIQGDAYCVSSSGGALEKEDLVIGSDGSIANVIVYVKKGADSWEFPKPAAAKLTQKACQYVPHVIGVMAGQDVEISSQDGTTHNVHFFGKANKEFNFTQKKDQKDVKVFNRAEFAQIKCDVHTWMGAHIGVFYHPFFQVTGSKGSFDLGKLPAGDYVIEAWHEKLGTQTQNVTLGDGESKSISFSFSKG